MNMANAIVGQSGGPTSVINSSLAGVYESAIERGAEKVYGMLNGIQGLLEKRITDLSLFFDNSLNIEALKRTPSSFLGSCRYKLPISIRKEARKSMISSSVILMRSMSNISSISVEMIPWIPS